MKYLGAVLAALAFGTGLMAAWRWYQSSKVQIDPGWWQPGSGRPIEPVGESAKAMDWSVATLKAFNEASALNKKAAVWTAASVLFAAAASLVNTVSL